MKKPSVVIVTPALADANNGNWQTALRWQHMLSATCHTRIVREWPDGAAAVRDDIMIALHARRSAASAAAWADAHHGRGLAVVLTGTDLYGDIRDNQAARRSLELAQRLVVLQDRGPDALPVQWRRKARVIFQSTTFRQPMVKTRRHLRAIMVGHLREVKSPQTLFAVARRLRGAPDILIDHIGAALEPALGKLASATAKDCPHYRWLGALPHETVRRRIQRAHVLVHCSRVEGGAHVVMEAICSGTPVLASRVDGNVGMLGDGYSGYFEHGDADALCSLLLRCRADLVDNQKKSGNLTSTLREQCRLRQHLFDPAVEREALCRLVRELI